MLLIDHVDDRWGHFELNNIKFIEKYINKIFCRHQNMYTTQESSHFMIDGILLNPLNTKIYTGLKCVSYEVGM